MNKKGMEGNMVGTLVIVAVAIIVGLVLLQQSAVNIGQMTQTVNVANESLGSVVVNGTAQYLVKYKAISDVVILNQTGTLEIDAADYAITNNVIYNGQEAVKIVPNTGAATKTIWRVSGVAQPLTYETNGGGRAIADVVIVFFALAIAGIALVVVMKSDILDY
jgi:hypothetical protein